jgi:drug/metabolite transporter (DMT)-like permease
MNHLGEIYGLLTAFLWTITSLAFQVSAKKFGSLTVNLVRLVLAFFILSIFEYFVRGKIFPVDADMHTWIWLGLSGIVGFVLGDYFLFKAYEQIGARVSQVIMALAPAFAAFFSWLMLGEIMTKPEFIGMFVTMLGISLVVINKNGDKNASLKNKYKFKYPIVGLIFALGGAIGQGLGLVLSKYGMGNFDAFAASQIRVFVGGIGFAIIFTVFNKWHLLKATTKNKKESLALVIGTFFGPFLGVSFSLLSVQKVSAGVAQTLMSIVPILIIPFSHFMFKEKIKFREIIGAFLAFLGITLFFVNF